MEKWTYEDVRQANAVLDMYCDHDIARNAYITANRNRE